MGEIVEKQPQCHPHQQGRGKPAVEHEGQEPLPGCRHHNDQEEAAGNAPFQKLVASPEAAMEEEVLVVEEAGRNEPEGTKGGHRVVRVLLRVVHVGVVLQVNPREHRIAEPQQHGGPMAHEGVPEAVGMGGAVAGVMDDGALHMEGQESCGHQQGEGPVAHEPPPDGQSRQQVAAQKQTHRRIPRFGGPEEVAGHGATVIRRRYRGGRGRRFCRGKDHGTVHHQGVPVGRVVPGSCIPVTLGKDCAVAACLVTGTAGGAGRLYQGPAPKVRLALCQRSPWPT